MQKANKTIQKECVQPLLKWYRTHARDLPWRKTNDPYAIWISEIMLQQTQVATVIPYWERWMKKLPSIQSLAKAPEQTILKLWEGLGYYRRARMLHQAAKTICDKFQGKFPMDHEAILSLPGIGPYTAGAIASIAFDQPRAILDGNVIRVLTRFYSIGTNPKDRDTQNQLWDLAGEWVSQSDLIKPRSPDNCSHLNQSIMELGASICLPGNQAQCPKCPLKRNCKAYKEALVSSLPNLPDRRPAVQLHRLVYVLEYRNQYLMQQKSSDAINGGLWEFFNVEAKEPASSGDTQRLSENTLIESGLKARNITPIKTIKHTITHHRITLHCFQGKIVNKLTPGDSDAQWVSHSDIQNLPMPSAHQKLRKLILQADE